MTQLFKNLFFTFVFTLFSVFLACKNPDEYLVDPNVPTPSQITYEYYINAVQTSFVDFLEEVSPFARQLTRMESYSRSNYTSSGIPPEATNEAWRKAYYDVLINIKKGYEAASAEKQRNHQAIFNILEAYTIVTLVDFFGDVPYAEALLGRENTNPKLDKGSDIYNAALTKLTLADTLFSSTAKYPANDLFFSGSTKDKISNWQRVINSIKLKIYVQRRLVDNNAKDSINTLLKRPLISQPSEDFQFRYSKNVSSPDSRHPLYAKSYTSSGVGSGADGSSLYFTPYSVNLISANTDPRWRFLVQRQADVAKATSNNYRCLTATRPKHFSATDLFCQVGTFWTRSHGEGGGISPDGNQRTAYGLYPVGGTFDKGYTVLYVNLGDGGNGIFPILTSSMVKFYRAEALLMLGTSDITAESLFLEGIKDFNEKLLTFSPSMDTSTSVYRNGYTQDWTSFLAARTTAFNAATSNDEKLKLIMEEFYKASWGSGIDVYNNYRRTGQPNDFTPMLTTDPGIFPHSLPYPREATALNKNIKEKNNANWPRVFWAVGGPELK